MNRKAPVDVDFDSLSLGDKLRNNLAPKGTLPVVLLRPSHSAGIELSHDFVREAINDTERLHFRTQLGDKVSALEKIGLMLLLESAHIEY